MPGRSLRGMFRRRREPNYYADRERIERAEQGLNEIIEQFTQPDVGQVNIPQSEPNSRRFFYPSAAQINTFNSINQTLTTESQTATEIAREEQRRWREQSEAMRQAAQSMNFIPSMQWSTAMDYSTRNVPPENNQDRKTVIARFRRNVKHNLL